ncbi:polysaccharide deacetylase family protein [Marinisporobacter balticus]|uniref:Polysaccharide deacetylase family sporulation protein PdaB n=1 Tax=Marinisporobacter balticus TaxID=2018667 RepID=A0A4R2KVH8_9FIRM|nr:polysaccharide deacetylase family protein [Marinisporobacter balticus]TCO75196.1 polysaccharide deacetylase family sporulation protein PdaB [Marinisporobacter balticus]
MKKKSTIMLIIFLLIIAFTIHHIYTTTSLINRIQTFIPFDTNHSEIIRNGPNDKKVIALTFDDGPHPRFTPQILDLLKKYDAKATFFVLGKHVALYPDVVKREVLEGHEIGNHTFTHIDVKQTPKKKIQEEFEKTQDEIFSVAGIHPKLLRPPFGFCNKTVINIASEKNYKIILWSAHQDSNDWRNPGIGVIIKKTLSEVGNGDIVLFHDYVEGPSHTLEALKVILPTLKEKGYEFVTISELLEHASIDEEIRKNN